MKGPSELVVRKALLQAHAEIERYEIARGLQTLAVSASPRAIVQHLLPGLVSDGSSPGTAWTRAGSQLASLYQRYPLVASAATSMLGRGRLSRVVQLAGMALAVVKAVGMARRSR